MKKTILILVALMLLPVAGFANSIMPDFANVPNGWITDRYQPDSFTNVGTYQGRDNVLGIGISSADSLPNRPAGQRSTFYNTQGMQYAVTGGPGSFLTADLWIESGWSNASAGSIRSDMWGVVDTADPAHSYPIIGFTNYGGTARYRVYDENTVDGWVDLATPVKYNDWTSFAILFTGTSYEYSIDGFVVYTDNTINLPTGFIATIMQAYNYYGDSSLTSAFPVDYTAHWSNTPTPEPGTMILMGVGALGVAFMRRRSQKKG